MTVLPVARQNLHAHKVALTRLDTPPPKRARKLLEVIAFVDTMKFPRARLPHEDFIRHCLVTHQDVLVPQLPEVYDRFFPGPSTSASPSTSAASSSTTAASSSASSSSAAPPSLPAAPAPEPKRRGRPSRSSPPPPRRPAGRVEFMRDLRERCRYHEDRPHRRFMAGEMSEEDVDVALQVGKTSLAYPDSLNDVECIGLCLAPRYLWRSTGSRTAPDVWWHAKVKVDGHEITLLVLYERLKTWPSAVAYARAHGFPASFLA